MTRILFSLPVHERPDIVRDLIKNINYFCPGSIICIHVSAGALESREEFQRACDFENVIINANSHETVWSGGIMHTHVSNFLYAVEKHAEFDKVIMISTNELLIKHGLADYVSKFDIGAQTEIYDKANDWGVFRDDYLNCEPIQGFLAEIGLPLFFGGQAEGQFFNRSIFLRLADLFVRNFPMEPFGFPLEEVLPATLAARYSIVGTSTALPITLCNYSNNLEILEETITQIRTGEGSLFARRVPKALRSPHIGASVLGGVFSVKRIPREDCDIRRFIRSLMV